MTQKQDQQMTENRIILRCACLAEVLSDRVAVENQKWQEMVEIEETRRSTALRRHVRILPRSAGRDGFSATAEQIVVFSVLKLKDRRNDLPLCWAPEVSCCASFPATYF